ncbi:Pseudouridine-5'-phosphatase [Podochytrium sp. JEL0797]|nr:Pseudouridine-5'-phosphatase [Podochytrium sp. JEL0797]
MATHALFDMDGLLLDTERIYTEVNADILSRFTDIPFTWEVKALMMGAKERESSELFVKHYQIPLTVDEYIVERRAKLAAKFPHCKVLPGVYRLIQHLKESGVPICVATSSHRKGFETKTQNHGSFFSLFEGSIICGDDPQIQNGKPAPDIFLAAAESLGLSPRESLNNRNCLVFEDSVLGARAALAAGMRVILVPDENLVVDPELVAKCAKVLLSMEEFDPAEFGFPAYPL